MCDDRRFGKQRGGGELISFGYRQRDHTPPFFTHMQNWEFLK